MPNKTIDFTGVAFFAPDGKIQCSTIHPDMSTCIAFQQMLSDSFMSMPPDVMLKAGFTILPIKCTFEITGTSEEMFQAEKKRLQSLDKSHIRNRKQ